MTHLWNISLFAGLAERLGTRELHLTWKEAQLTAGQIKVKLMADYPEHADLLSICFLAQNQAYAPDGRLVSSTDELALLPPVSGGSEEAADEEWNSSPKPLYFITEQPLDVQSILSLVSHPDHGASLVFLGTTREWTHGQRTVKLEYEAYVPMAEASLHQIGEEIRMRWEGTISSIAHRIGQVGIGEISVVIAISSPHRAAAYEASRYAIERLKQTVPIWKKEVYEDGSEWKGHQLGPWDPTLSLEELGGEQK